MTTDRNDSPDGAPSKPSPPGTGPESADSATDDTSSQAPPQASRPRPHRATPPRGVRQRAGQYVSHILSIEASKRRFAVPLYVLRILVQVVRQWARDRCPQQASSLAFQTVLSLVPLLAVALAVFRSTGSIHEESSLIAFLSRTYIPVRREAIASTLTSWTDNVSFQSLGVFGIITTMVLAFILFNSLERIMNDIWRAERRRPLTQKFVVFYAVVTIVPFLLGMSLYQMSQLGLGSGTAQFMLSLAASFCACFVANYVLPTSKVQIGPAAIGALVSSMLFEIAKYAFEAYAGGIAYEKYSGIYGAVALAPLFLIWVYWTWLTLLLGTEVAYAVQHLSLLERRERRGTMSLENELVRRVNGVVAARVMAAVAQTYVAGGKHCTRRTLTERFDLSEEVLERIVSRLKDAELLLDVRSEQAGFVPARPPTEISLADVLAVFRGDDVMDSHPHQETQLDRVLRKLDADVRQLTGDLTLDELIDR